MARFLDDSVRWAVSGAKQFTHAIGGFQDADWDAPSLLPGWTRRQVVSHVAANAGALGNLVHWAKTGQPTPMYATPKARSEGIEQGSVMATTALEAWARDAQATLETAWDDLGDAQWTAEVVTAQGRTVPASEIPWLRAREVWIHSVDLDSGVVFWDLPEDFLLALRADVHLKRGDVPAVRAPLAEELAWLTGRPHSLLDAPLLPAWL